MRIANDSDYGLSSAVWSADHGRAIVVACKLGTSQVAVKGGRFSLCAPFGGYRQSGNGLEFGHFGLEDFLEVKTLLGGVA